MSALMNCTRCEVCEAAVNVYAPLSFVHLSLLFRLLLEPICTLGAIVLTIAVYQTRALHFNARVLLVCMTASVAVSNIGVLLDAVYKLFVSFVLPEDLRCEYQVFKPVYFYVFRNIHIAGGLGLALSTLSLAAERALATVTYMSYEQRSLVDSQLRVLSTRFQLRENIATTRLMAPVMFVVALMTTSSQWVYYFHLPDLHEETVVTTSVLEKVVDFAPYSEYQVSLPFSSHIAYPMRSEKFPLIIGDMYVLTCILLGWQLISWTLKNLQQKYLLTNN
ncbi:unnamed protein product [Heligmosomoides polygyrus]|uniref:G protein-coupled receptor n=1 Tax=Heligmosomoides polygyrus TaxID=6339 RepID=A0A3P8C1H0_HELPZ|nr:unnamed protein product [Heligmosomoides polygyrus]